jgi:hypothetical protein
MALYGAPRLKKGYQKILKGGRPICNPKILKGGPKFFALTPSVKRAFNKSTVLNISGMYLLSGPRHLTGLGLCDLFPKPKTRLIRY